MANSNNSPAAANSDVELIVAALHAGETTVDAIKARVRDKKLDALDAMDAIGRFADEQKAKAAAPRTITFKVTEKGGVSAYGLNARFPVTLYADQWERLMSRRDDLLAFIRDNAAKLSRK